MRCERRAFLSNAKTTAVMMALGALLVGDAPAHACGGFFCSQTTNPFDPPPVAQTAENVLFAMERTASGQIHLEAHVQIFYQGPADVFSWVVPVDTEPKVSVGTNQLFQALDPATQPQFQVSWHEEGTCKETIAPPLSGAGGSAGSGFSADAGVSRVDGGSPGVQIAFRGDVGPYDAVVIHSTDPHDPKPLKEWLATNKYYLSPDGSKLIDDYVLQDKYFVAIRLINGHQVNEIQPLVMRFDGPGPCIPLRLTAVAAIQDLRINLWVLADARVVPQNFYEIEINPARIDWFNGGNNYAELVKRAANEAGGNAFVTEYAGPADILAGRIATGIYDISRLAMVKTPPEAIDEIARQGFPRDATLVEILRKHIPEPAALKSQGVSEQTFYNQIRFYWQSQQALFAPFDPMAFATEVDAKLVAPQKKAQELFTRFTKLTRLSTFISPEEMTVDPQFMTNATLPPVPLVRTANAYAMCEQKKYTRCEAPIRLELPDGQKLFFKAKPMTDGYCYSPGAGVDRGAIDQMPALETGWRREAAGEGAVRFDNRAAIAGAIAAHNGAAGGPTIVLPAADGGASSPSGRDGRRGSGCAISPAAAPAGVWVVVSVMALVAATRRRRSS